MGMFCRKLGTKQSPTEWRGFGFQFQVNRGVSPAKTDVDPKANPYVVVVVEQPGHVKVSRGIHSLELRAQEEVHRVSIATDFLEAEQKRASCSLTGQPLVVVRVHGGGSAVASAQRDVEALACRTAWEIPQFRNDNEARARGGYLVGHVGVE